MDETYTTPNGVVSVHKLHHGMPLSVTNTSLHYPISLLQLTPNQTVDISCLATIPSYASVADGFADIQNHTVSGNNKIMILGRLTLHGWRATFLILLNSCLFPY